MGSEAPGRKQPGAVTGRLIDAAIKSFMKTLPPGTYVPHFRAHIGLQLEKLFKTYPTPDHPPYALMIRQAIEELNEEHGSDEKEISTSIRLKYQSLPWGHTSLLSHHLKKLSSEGEIIRLSDDRYILHPEENGAINTVKQKQKRKRNTLQKEKSAKQRKLSENDRLQSFGGEAACEESRSVAKAEGVEKRKWLQEKQVQVSERSNFEGTIVPCQQKILGIKITEKVRHVIDERVQEMIEDAAEEQAQSQEQQAEVDGLLKTEEINGPRQDKSSEVEASEATYRVLEKQKHVETEGSDPGFEDISQVIGGNREEGLRGEVSVKDLKQGGYTLCELVEDTSQENEQYDAVNIHDQLQKKSDHLFLEDDLHKMQENCQLPEKLNQEDEGPENILIENQVKEQPQDPLVETQLDETIEQKNQQEKQWTPVDGPALQLQDIETEIEGIEKFIESHTPQDEVIRNGAKQHEKQAKEWSPIADKRQWEGESVLKSCPFLFRTCQRLRLVGSSSSSKEKCLQLLERTEGIMNCLFQILKSVNTNERSVNANLETSLDGEENGTHGQEEPTVLGNEPIMRDIATEEPTVLGNKLIMRDVSTDLNIASLVPPPPGQQQVAALIQEGKQPYIEICKQQQEILGRGIKPEGPKHQRGLITHGQRKHFESESNAAPIFTAASLPPINCEQMEPRTLMKPSVLSGEKLNPLKRAELVNLVIRPNEPPTTPGKKRGRPPKVKADRYEGSPVAKKRLGRPPKTKPGGAEGEESPLTPKRRGRPPKPKHDAADATISNKAGSASPSPDKPRQGRGS